jgi:hypothetical protein
MFSNALPASKSSSRFSRIKQMRQKRRSAKPTFLTQFPMPIATSAEVKSPQVFSHFVRVLWNLIKGMVVFTIITSMAAIAGLVLFWFFWWPPNRFSSTQNYLFVNQSSTDIKGSIILVHLEPGAKKIEVSLFNKDLPVELLGGYGQYSLRSVFPLLQLDHRSNQYISTAYSAALGLPIQQVIPLGNEAEKLTDVTSSKQLNLQMFWWQILTYRWPSSLSFPERFLLYRFGQSVSTDQITTNQIKSNDDWLKVRHQLGLPEVNPDCSVAVLNTTEVAGTGSMITQVLENAGITVIRLSDTPDRLAQTKLFVTQPSPFCLSVISQIQPLFPLDVRQEVVGETMSKYRTNIVVLIGQDFAQEVKKQKK